MSLSAKFVHTNIVAKDWRRLATFYIKVFGCTAQPPERNLCGPWLDTLTGLKRAQIHGIHLRLPGYGSDGPTIEVFQYHKAKNGIPGINRTGFAHIAFAVPDVRRALQRVERNGGGRVGTLVSTVIDGVGRIDVVYARDPEGNIIELQKWT